MANIGSIDIGSSFSTAGLAAGIQKARSLLSGFADKVSGVTTAFTGFAAAMAANAAFQTLSGVVQSSMDAIDKLGDSAQRLGTTTANLSALQHAVNLTGSEVEFLVPSIQKMSINLSKAGEDSKQAQAAFSKLGLDAAKLKQMDPSEAFIAISDAISQVPSQADRASYAMAVFGKSGTGLLNTLASGQGTIRALMDEAVALGLAFSDVDAANIGAAKDALDRASGAMTGIGNQLTIKLAPTIEYAADKFLELAKSGTGAAQMMDGGIALLNATIWLTAKAVNVVGATFKFVQGLATGALHVVATILSGIISAVEWLTNKIPGMSSNFGEQGRAIADDLGKLAKEQLGDSGKEAMGLFFGTEEFQKATSAASSTATAVKGVGEAFGEMGDKVDESAKKIQASQDKLKDQIATFGMTAEQIEIYKLRQEGASEAVIQNVQAMQRQIATLEAKKKADEQAAADAKSIIEANLTPLEKYQQELQKIEALQQRGALSPDMAGRAAEKARKALDDATKSKVKTEDPDKDLKSQAKSVIEATRTPLEKYNAEILKLKEMLGKGLIDPQTFQRAQLDAQKTLKESGTKEADKEQRSPFANALELGSNEARATILRNRGIGGKDPSSKIEANTKEQVAQSKETNRLLTQMVNRTGTDGATVVMDF